MAPSSRGQKTSFSGKKRSWPSWPSRKTSKRRISGERSRRRTTPSPAWPTVRPSFLNGTRRIFQSLFWLVILDSLNKYSELERQFKVLRERCSEELGQKDAEIFSLKARLEAPPATSPDNLPPGITSPSLAAAKPTEPPPTFAELLQKDQSVADILASQTRDQDLVFLSNQVESLKEVIVENEKHEEQFKSQAQVRLCPHSSSSARMCAWGGVACFDLIISPCSCSKTRSGDSRRTFGESPITWNTSRTWWSSSWNVTSKKPGNCCRPSSPCWSSPLRRRRKSRLYGRTPGHGTYFN